MRNQMLLRSTGALAHTALANSAMESICALANRAKLRFSVAQWCKLVDELD